jgi:hypothetical protein
LGDELFHQSFQLAKGPRDEQQDTVLCLTDLEQTRALLVVSDGWAETRVVAWHP